MYQYSLDAFNSFLQKAIDRTQVGGGGGGAPAAEGAPAAAAERALGSARARRRCRSARSCSSHRPGSPSSAGPVPKGRWKRSPRGLLFRGGRVIFLAVGLSCAVLLPLLCSYDGHGNGQTQELARRQVMCSSV